MTLRLVLMRHAKSSWGEPGLADHARPLNGRGRRSAEAMGQWLVQQGILPGEVLSSDSQRTRETWAEAAPAFPQEIPVSWRPELYHAGPDRMLRLLQKAKAETVLLLGHNPGCAAFAEMIVSDPPDHDRFRDYPTAATLVVDLPTTAWSQVTWRIGRPLAFATPRELGVT